MTSVMGHDSVNQPAPSPFSPFSSSSSRRKLRGTFAPILEIEEGFGVRTRVERLLGGKQARSKPVVLPESLKEVNRIWMRPANGGKEARALLAPLRHLNRSGNGKSSASNFPLFPSMTVQRNKLQA